MAPHLPIATMIQGREAAITQLPASVLCSFRSFNITVRRENKTMKRVWLTVVALLATSALSGAAVSASPAAACVQVAEPGIGNWRNSTCTLAAPPGEYIKIKKLIVIKAGIWCAEATEANTGNWTDSACTTKGKGNFIRVHQIQRWQVKGAEPSAKQPIKLQLKGKIKLAIPTEEFEILCKGSTSEGSSIEAQGKNHSGQGKGRFTYKGCETNKTECNVAEPITLNQIKSYLGVSENNAEKSARAIDVFEPEKGKVLTELKIKGFGCGVLAGTIPVDGSLTAEVGPEEAEVKEGLWNFPSEAIKIVKTENGENTVGIKFGGTGLESTFSADYGAQLESGEAFGVGG